LLINNRNFGQRQEHRLALNTMLARDRRQKDSGQKNNTDPFLFFCPRFFCRDLGGARRVFLDTDLRRLP
jgi:hypothetical protein